MDAAWPVISKPSTRALYRASCVKSPIGDVRRAAEKLVLGLSNASAQYFQNALSEIARLPAAQMDLITDQARSEPIEDVFAGCLVSETDPEVRKKRGAVYTPNWFAGRVTESAFRHWKKLHRNGQEPKIIADVSCGAGVFLSAIRKTVGPGPKVFGCDIDPKAVAYSELLGLAENGHWELKCGDTLRETVRQGALFANRERKDNIAKYDLLVGNPPYVRSSILNAEYTAFLKSNFECLSDGNFDLSVAFIDSALELLADGGVFSYIVTSKFCHSSYGRKLCNKLADFSQVLNIEFFGDHQLFKGYTTYVMVLTAAKTPPGKRFMVTTFPAGTLNKDLSGRTSTLPTQKLRELPWNFASGEDREALDLLHAPKHPLLTEVLGDVFQGIRTGANDVFVLLQKDSIRIEADRLLPFVTGRQVSRFSVDSDALRLVYPYLVDEFGDAKSITPDRLASSYPKLFRHLQFHRTALTERSHDETTAWYAYSRTQNLAGHRLRKLLVKEMMPRAEFAADFSGTIAFGSGYAVDASRLTKDELMLWVAILNTPIMEFSLRHIGTQLHSGWFRLMKHHLRRVRLPILSDSQKHRAIDIARALHQAPNESSSTLLLDDLNEVVADAFDLAPKHIAAVDGYLRECHQKSLRAVENDISCSGHTDDQSQYEPVQLNRYNSLHRERFDLQRSVTFKDSKKLPIHRWYSFTQGFSPALVEHLLSELNVSADSVVMDPFVGSGTTIVTCQARGVSSVGVDVSPLMTWVASVKAAVYDHARITSLIDSCSFEKAALRPPPKHRGSQLFTNYFAQAYAPKILAQLFALASHLEELNASERERDFLRLGLVGLLEEVSNIRKHGSHYRYLNKPSSVGLLKLNIPIISENANVGKILRERLKSMADDLRSRTDFPAGISTRVLIGDARNLTLPDRSVAHIITSPPYLNRNNYIAQQKAELAILGFIDKRSEYKALVHATFRSHVESSLNKHIESRFPEVRKIVSKIKLTPGNNPKIPHMVCGYFDDLAATLTSIYRVLKPGGLAAFVVGNTRWGGIVIPIDHLLLMIAEKAGFRSERILITRLKGNSPQQMRMYGRIPVRESVVIFKKP